MNWRDVLSWLGPNEANAEVIPTTPGAQKVLHEALGQEGPAGDITRLAHSLKDKVYLSDKPSMAQRFGAPQLGTFKSGFTGKNKAQLNAPLLEYRQTQGAKKSEPVDVLAHELGHFVAQATGVGGEAKPTGMAPLDEAYRMFAAPFGKSLKINRDVNEKVADVLAGLEKADPSTQALVAEILAKAKLRIR